MFTTRSNANNALLFETIPAPALCVVLVQPGGSAQSAQLATGNVRFCKNNPNFFISRFPRFSACNKTHVRVTHLQLESFQEKICSFPYTTFGFECFLPTRNEKPTFEPLGTIPFRTHPVVSCCLKLTEMVVGGRKVWQNLLPRLSACSLDSFRTKHNAEDSINSLGE